MNEITQEFVSDTRNVNQQLLEAKNEMFRVLVQDEFIAYFSDPEQNYGGGSCEAYHGLAKTFKEQIMQLYAAGFFNKSLLWYMSRRFCRCEGCATVAYEKISDEELGTLHAEEIVTIYLGEIIHERWRGAFKALFEDPFFLKSLRRLKQLLENDDLGLQRTSIPQNPSYRQTPEKPIK